MNATPLPADRWAMDELVPHSGAMVLLDRVVSATADSLVASAVIDHCSPFYRAGDDIEAWWAVEYLAQGVAALAGLRERMAGRDVPWGFLTSCRRFTTSGPAIPLGTSVEITVREMIAMDAGMAAFECRMEGSGFSAESLISVYGMDREAEVGSD